MSNFDQEKKMPAYVYHETVDKCKTNLVYCVIGMEKALIRYDFGSTAPIFRVTNVCNIECKTGLVCTLS